MLGAESLYIRTGQTNYSGIGRNARATNIVDMFDPYSAVPVPGLTATVQRRTGERIKATKVYWRPIGLLARIRGSYLLSSLSRGADRGISTRDANRRQDGRRDYRPKDLKGTVILLSVPNLPLMVEQREKELQKSGVVKGGHAKQHGRRPSKAKRSVGSQFIGALIEIDKIVRAKSERTPAPEWANAKEYENGAGT